MERPEEPVFPFAAVVGLEEVRDLLVLALVNPALGPVAVLGPVGSGKTTAIRSLADLLPKEEFSFACPSNCLTTGGDVCDRCSALSKSGKLRKTRRIMPYVRVPITSTWEELAGRPAQHVPRDPDLWEHWEPGLLARANRGLLVVERAGQLETGILERLLSCIDGGRVSLQSGSRRFSYPCRPSPILEFDGQRLPPAAAGRCRLVARSAAPSTMEERVMLLKRVQEFDTAPEELRKGFDVQTAELRTRILSARMSLRGMPPQAGVVAEAKKRAAGKGVPDAWPALLQAALAEAAIEGKIATSEHLEDAARFLAANPPPPKGGGVS